VLLARYRVQRRWLVASDGGTVELRREVLTTASHGCLIRARYELHEVTMVLPKQRERTRRILATPTTAASSSGKVMHKAVTAEVANVPLPRLNRLS